MGLGERWVRFLRQYGPIPRNDNMYDEHILRSARRLGVRAIDFAHPLEADLLEALSPSAPAARSIVLTGTAGDGKSRLCGRAWWSIGGDPVAWASDEIYHETRATVAGRARKVGIIRDLTALPHAGRYGAHPDKHALLRAVSASVFDPDPDQVYIVAANDGQLMEGWRRLGDSPEAARAHEVFEGLLVGDEPGQGRVAFFNLSAVPCASLFELVCDALLAHEGWEAARFEAEPGGFFGPDCPIRHNYQTLAEPGFRARMRQLFELMDLSELHTPIRRVLLLLSNAILGHPHVKDRLMLPGDVRSLVSEGRAHLGDIVQNVFGANLTPARRDGLEIMEFIGRFGIGDETTNRIDNILLFGPHDDALRPYYEALAERRSSVASLDSFSAARNAYLERPEGAGEGDHPFLAALAGERRALFFRIPEEQEEELALWDLTVFRHAGQFLRDVARPLASGGQVPRKVLAALVNGLNRVFTGMLVSTDRELLLATGLGGGSSGANQILSERVSVSPRRDERVELRRTARMPELVVQLDAATRCALPLNLVRFEFLMRVAEGALPGSFSRECQEDILGFKASILAALARSRPKEDSGALAFRLLSLNADGEPADDVIEVDVD